MPMNDLDRLAQKLAERMNVPSEPDARMVHVEMRAEMREITKAVTMLTELTKGHDKRISDLERTRAATVANREMWKWLIQSTPSFVAIVGVIYLVGRSFGAG